MQRETFQIEKGTEENLGYPRAKCAVSSEDHFASFGFSGFSSLSSRA
jgi:hypothetical protein